jgi:hypothetical protein
MASLNFTAREAPYLDALPLGGCDFERESLGYRAVDE